MDYATIKINQFIVMAVYAPTSLGPDCLQSFLDETKTLTRDLATDPASLSRHRILADGSLPYLFRVDTGASPTRPAKRVDSILDTAHSSGHQQISARIISSSRPSDYSRRYCRLRTEKLCIPEIRNEYCTAVSTKINDLRSHISTRPPSTVTRLSSLLR